MSDSVTITMTIERVGVDEFKTTAHIHDDPEGITYIAGERYPSSTAMESGSRVLDLMKPLWMMRSTSERRGPDVVVECSSPGFWPQSNLYRDGCKHDVTIADAKRFDKGETVRCAKCDAQLVPVKDEEEED